jgi:hypothetical protein
MQEVRGSSPLISTMIRKELQEVGNRGVAGLFVFPATVYHFFTTRYIVSQIYRVLQVLVGEVSIPHSHGRMAQEFLNGLDLPTNQRFQGNRQPIRNSLVDLFRQFEDSLALGNPIALGPEVGGRIR